MTDRDLIDIEVAYASASTYKIIPIKVPTGTLIEEAITLSGLLQYFPEISHENRVGIFGQIKERTDLVHANDRVEIYRPITQEAITLRKERAAKVVKLKKNWAKDLQKHAQPYRRQNKQQDDGA